MCHHAMPIILVHSFSRSNSNVLIKRAHSMPSIMNKRTNYILSISTRKTRGVIFRPKNYHLIVTSDMVFCCSFTVFAEVRNLFPKMSAYNHVIHVVTEICNRWWFQSVQIVAGWLFLLILLCINRYFCCFYAVVRLYGVLLSRPLLKSLVYFGKTYFELFSTHPIHVIQNSLNSSSLLKYQLCTIRGFSYIMQNENE